MKTTGWPSLSSEPTISCDSLLNPYGLAGSSGRDSSMGPSPGPYTSAELGINSAADGA